MKQGIEKGYLKFNKNDYSDNDNFFVLNPDKFLELLTNKKINVSKKESNYIAKENEFIIEYWYNPVTRYGHFARIKKGFNSLQKSKTVENGKIESLRVFRLII